MAPHHRLSHLHTHLRPRPLSSTARDPPSLSVQRPADALPCAAAAAAAASAGTLPITDVKCYIVGTRRSGEQLMLGNGRACIIVKVEAAGGALYGWGEAGVLGREMAVKGAVLHYRQFLIGSDAMRLGALWQEMYRSQYFEGGRILTGAISAIDMALHDMVARKLGIPVYQLLGGAQRDAVPCFGTVGENMHGDKTPTVARDGGVEMVEHARVLATEQGYQCVRLVYDGTSDASGIFEPRDAIANTVEHCIGARKACGPKTVLGLEWHHRLSVAEAASFCQKLPPGTLDWVEEIIRDECTCNHRLL